MQATEKVGAGPCRPIVFGCSHVTLTNSMTAIVQPTAIVQSFDVPLSEYSLSRAPRYAVGAEQSSGRARRR
jgi:hypothetical protein